MSLKRYPNTLSRQISAKQYFKSRLPFIHSHLPAQQSFITVFRKRRPNLIKMKQLHSLKEKEERMNLTILKNFADQERKQRRRVNLSFDRFKKQQETPSPNKIKIRNFYYFALQQKMAESKRYFSLHK